MSSSLPELDPADGVPILATPAEMIQMFTRFGFLVLTPTRILFVNKKGKHIFAADLSQVELGIDKSWKEALYGQRLVVNYKDESMREQTKKFSFVRTWGTTVTVGLPTDATREARVLYDLLNSGTTASEWVEGVERVKSGQPGRVPASPPAPPKLPEGQETLE